MITEGADGRIFEVTAEGEIVWEYISPYFGEERPDRNMIYRAYRMPYDWIPQLEKPEERAVRPPALKDFRIEPQQGTLRWRQLSLGRGALTPWSRVLRRTRE